MCGSTAKQSWVLCVVAAYHIFEWDGGGAKFSESAKIADPGGFESPRDANHGLFINE